MKIGDRVVQIPMVGPMRYGEIINVEEKEFAIIWDNTPDLTEWFEDDTEGIWICSRT